ncbi:MAG: beta-lactamase family protein [Ruminococcaceae bacterium]|nr:beta-lactamase family protein [Oscillospiraceae bacterium]
MNFEKVTAYLDSLCDTKGVGMSDLIVLKDHEVVYRKQAGYKSPEKKIPLKGDEWYYIFSASKMTTCVAAMQLIERGAMRLEDNVSKFIPEFEHLYLKNGEEAKRPLTIFHLMSMRGGFNYDLDECLEDVKKNPDATTLDYVKAMAKKKLLFHPGDMYEYSLCHDILAGVVEVVSGMSFGEYVKKNIFEPLGIKDVKFRYEDGEEERFASQFLYNEDGSFTDIPLNNAYKLGPLYESGGAGLIASVAEYSKLPDALANGGMGATGNRILKPESVEKFKMDTMYGDTREGRMHEKGYSYGLGFRTLVTKNYAQKSPIGEFGWDGAMGCYYLIDTENHLALFYATHMASEHSFLSSEVHPTIRNLVYDALDL